MPRLRPIDVRISLISFSDLRPKFFVFSMSASVFCTSSRIVRMFAFLRQLYERTESSSSSTLLSRCSLIEEAGDTPFEGGAEAPRSINEHLDKSVEELELSVRSYNCLRNANIKTIRELVQKTEGDMLKTKNFGRKSLNEIKEILGTMGLSLGMKLDNYPGAPAAQTEESRG